MIIKVNEVRGSVDRWISGSVDRWISGFGKPACGQVQSFLINNIIRFSASRNSF